MGNRFDIATGNIPKEPIVQEQKPVEDSKYLFDDPEKALSNSYNPSYSGLPSYGLQTGPRSPDFGPAESYGNLFPQTPRNRSLYGPNGAITNRSQFLRIMGPNGAQIVIPLRNIEAHAQPTENYRVYDLILRLPRPQAEAIMVDINEAQARQEV